MSEPDDLSDENPDYDKFAADWERHSSALYERIADYMDEADLDEEIMGQLLLEATINMRMTAYAMSVEHPSVGGLKLDLDRLKREVEEFLREAKKGAEDFIGRIKDARAEAEAALEAEGDEDEDGEGGEPAAN